MSVRRALEAVWICPCAGHVTVLTGESSESAGSGKDTAEGRGVCREAEYSRNAGARFLKETRYVLFFTTLQSQIFTVLYNHRSSLLCVYRSSLLCDHGEKLEVFIAVVD